MSDIVQFDNYFHEVNGGLQLIPRIVEFRKLKVLHECI